MIVPILAEVPDTNVPKSYIRGSSTLVSLSDIILRLKYILPKFSSLLPLSATSSYCGGGRSAWHPNRVRLISGRTLMFFAQPDFYGHTCILIYPESRGLLTLELNGDSLSAISLIWFGK